MESRLLKTALSLATLHLFCICLSILIDSLECALLLYFYLNLSQREATSETGGSERKNREERRKEKEIFL